LLAAYGYLRSQSRWAEYLKNAQAESLWSRRKTEELKARKRPVFCDLADAQQSVATYFDYYNHYRCHSAMAY
jgi:putative transposase